MEDSQRKNTASKEHRAEKQHHFALEILRKLDTAYDQYLNSFVKLEDKRYLPNDNVIHQLVPLRAAVGAVVMTPSQFHEVHFSPLGACFNFSDSVTSDPLLMALVEREKLNVTKTISTIVFVSTRDSKGFNVSGYIDFEQSLRRFKAAGSKSHPWADIFAGRRRLEPNHQDLSFITWSNGRVFSNDSDNYKVIPDAVKGLCFSHKGDGSMLSIEKYITEEHPLCKFIESPKHGSTVVYDHHIRRMM
ncbi:cilia- and flagella-associated protein 299 [Drosophila teissieri]|uniref:cilia- and flagella-associated protein 299 n=1 Tax=Drosophila teissieri TaxID=7243 RepID=UPI001CBA539B|nr:cilia- and flagella-associated protein 299 [Drosophila teissieri]